MTDAGPASSADHFSSVSAAYSAFRPRYPEALADWIASVAPARRLAWDCGAGSGQATTDLARRFEYVAATDLSAEQVDRGPRDSRIGWAVCTAECSAIRSRSANAVTVAQALHWFRHDEFYAEVRRVASGADVPLVAWVYAAPTMDGAAGAVLHRFMYEDVGAYWPPERAYVDMEYRTIPFPFERIDPPRFALDNAWALPQVLGYMRSMSATSRFQKAHGFDPVARVEPELRALWPDDSLRRIVWPVIVLAGRVGQ